MGKPKPCINLTESCKAAVFRAFIYYVIEAGFLNASLFAHLE